MDNHDMQRMVLDAIQTVVKSEISQNTTTSSKIGYVAVDPLGYDCEVMIGDQSFSCQIPEHLHSWIQKDDIVIIQDLYGNGSKKVVTGKTGSRRSSPSLVFFDEGIERNIGSVDMVFDEVGNSEIDNTYGTIEKE